MDKGRENDKDKYKILCSKNDVVLKRANHSSSDANSNANTFVIDFEIVNSEITLDRFCSFNIFKLLFELNREDAIQDLRIVDLNDADKNNAKDILIIFKKKCDDVGIKQKYMKTRLMLAVLRNEQTGVANYVFESDIDPKFGPLFESTEPVAGGRMEELRDIGTVLCMSLINAHRLRMQFKISVPISVQKQPSYIENSLALIMKKIFTRLKEFIEVMKAN
jgi:hypothetical protein